MPTACVCAYAHPSVKTVSPVHKLDNLTVRPAHLVNAQFTLESDVS